MQSYDEFIQGARLVNELEECLTTGDLEYSGTAWEVSELSGNELFHVVMDSGGQQQVLFIPQKREFRIPLELLLLVLERAKKNVQVAGL